MNTIHILLCIDEHYTQHAGVTIASILYNKKSMNPVVFHIVNDDVSAESYEKLKQVTDKYGAKIVLHKIDSDCVNHLPVNKHLSKAAYYRLLVAEILSCEIEKVLYLDVDLLVRSDITALWDTDISGKYVAAVQDLGIESKGEYLRKILKMPPQEPYFNSGVLLINLKKWREDFINSKILAFIDENADKVIYPDQDGLNAILWGKWVFLHPKWNAYRVLFRKYYKFSERKKLPEEFRQAAKNPNIVHFTGALKAWHAGCLMPYVKEYYIYLAMTPWKNYQPQSTTLHQSFRKYRQYLRRFLMDIGD